MLDYTLAEAVSTRIPISPRLVRGPAKADLWPTDLPPPERLADRDQGEAIVDHRTSWVRRIDTARGGVFIKTYEYATWASRLRDFGHRTRPGARSRAAAEFDALHWMRQRGLPAPEPIAALEWRRFGFLVRATLVSTAAPGEPAAVVLPRLPQGDRAELARAIGTLVRRLHALGFRDRNLDLRNLVVHCSHGEWAIAKIDSPRHRLVPPGRPTDSLAREDWARLLPQLEALGVAAAACRAAGMPQP